MYTLNLNHCLPFLSTYSKPLLYIALLLSILAYFTTTKLLTPKPPTQRPPTPDLEKPSLRTASKFKAPKRPLGVWTPVAFKRPAAPPYPDWDVHTTEPLPYRPFKYGTYHITMGLRTMHWDDWIELDNQFLKFHAIKSQRIKERGEKCCRTAPEAYDGAVELLEELSVPHSSNPSYFSPLIRNATCRADYLSQRYPSLYTRTPTTLTNTLTHETFPLVPPLPEDPMTTCGRLVQDDLAIMFERPDGQYYLLAGSILLAGFWRLQDKVGMPLSEIHTSGDVPGFKPKLERGMMSFFRRIQPAQPVVRNNYFIQVDDELAWSSSIGSEDVETEGGQQQVEGWSSAQRNKAVEHHHFRSERQSLRRLPRSGGVVFTIRTYFEPVVRIAREKGVPGRLASGVRSWGEDTARYKGRETYGEVLLEYLDRCHREQVERGEVVEDQVKDEGGRYPF